jgi:dihydroflavonol-4-reductase
MNTAPKQSILVTGASGFIGAHLVRRLIARGDRVSCVVRATSAVHELRAAGAEFISCDVNDHAGMTRAVAYSKASVVFHLAGLVKALKRADFIRVNVKGVDSVAAACADQPVRPVLVMASSLAATGPSRIDRPHVEDDPPAPVSDYGVSKLEGERAASKYAAVLPITFVRPCVVFGPGDRGVFEMFKPIARSGIHAVPGCAAERLSLVHVADVVECLLLAAEKGERVTPGGGPGSGVYFAADADMDYVQLGHVIAASLGKKPPRVVKMPRFLMKAAGCGGDLISRIRGRAGWVGSDKIADVLAGSWTCSPAKARQQLGWSPVAPIADRLRETARWYREAGWL